MENISNARAGSVLAALEAQLDTTHHGTLLHPAGLVPYNTHDRSEELKTSCKVFVGHGVVCSDMDRSGSILTWLCPHNFCCRLVRDHKS